MIGNVVKYCFPSGNYLKALYHICQIDDLMCSAFFQGQYWIFTNNIRHEWFIRAPLTPLGLGILEMHDWHARSAHVDTCSEWQTHETRLVLSYRSHLLHSKLQDYNSRSSFWFGGTLAPHLLYILTQNSGSSTLLSLQRNITQRNG